MAVTSPTPPSPLSKDHLRLGQDPDMFIERADSRVQTSSHSHDSMHFVESPDGDSSSLRPGSDCIHGYMRADRCLGQTGMSRSKSGVVHLLCTEQERLTREGRFSSMTATSLNYLVGAWCHPRRGAAQLRGMGDGRRYLGC